MQEEWPKEKFQNPSQEAYVRLLTITSHLARQADELLRSANITQPQYNVLRILVGAGPEGLGRNEIAARMITTTPDMTRLLIRIEEKGWIDRRRGTKDRREVPTTITEAGKRLVKEAASSLNDLHLRQFAALGAADTELLLRLLRGLSSAAQGESSRTVEHRIGVATPIESEHQ